MKRLKIRGMSLVEIVVGAALVLVSFTGLIAAYNLYLRQALAATPDIQATFLLEEGIEVVRFLRDAGWDANIEPLATGTPYSLLWSGSAWVSTTTRTLIDAQFDRIVTLGDAYRDGNGNLASSGTLDPTMRQVEVSVSWHGRDATTTRTLSGYIHDL
jgi:Tfp pilus assembly protein PilV